MMIKDLKNNFIKLPLIGQGVGEYKWDNRQVDIIREGIDLGMNFIDTAEIYDSGHSEELIGKAVYGIREKVIIGTKFSPEHHRYTDLINAANESLKRLKTDYIDLYQCHWPNSDVPLDETIRAMEKLIVDGKVRFAGMSNIYLVGLKNAQAAMKNFNISTLQVEYNLFDRSIENELLPFCAKSNIYIIAYSPLDQGRIADGLARRNLLEELSLKYNKTAAQICLRWLVYHKPVVVIPKARSRKHLLENADSVSFEIEEVDFNRIGQVFSRQVAYVQPDKIRVSANGQGNRPVYQTIQEALENKLGNVPSALSLSRSIIHENFVKPVRLVRLRDSQGGYEYDLVEGRIRYWAWVIAQGNEPIASYIRDDWEH